MQGKDLWHDGLLAVVLDSGVAKPHLDIFFYLAAHSLEDFLAGDVVALDRAVDPKGKRGVHADDEVEMAGRRCFEDQGGFADGVGCAAGH